MSKSKIEWTEATWNPTIGCTKVSPGCRDCYAAMRANRSMHMAGQVGKDYQGVVQKQPNGKINWTGRVNLLEHKLLRPVENKRPTIYFVNSMSDLFHPGVPNHYRDKVFAVMMLCPQHTFQVLTKYAEEMEIYMKDRYEGHEIDEAADMIVHSDPHLFYVTEKLTNPENPDFPGSFITNELRPKIKAAGWANDYTYSEYGKEVKFIYEGDWPAPNIWLGVSVENQEQATKRITRLMRTPAAVRFLSCEPLLSAIDITNKGIGNGYSVPTRTDYSNPGKPIGREWTAPADSFIGVDWVIVGGESISLDRPLHPDWVRSLRDQCEQSGSKPKFFFKQWGRWSPGPASLKDGLFMHPSGMVITGATPTYGDPIGHYTGMKRSSKRAAGRTLDGKTYDEMPEIKSLYVASEKLPF